MGCPRPCVIGLTVLWGYSLGSKEIQAGMALQYDETHLHRDHQIPHGGIAQLVARPTRVSLTHLV